MVVGIAPAQNIHRLEEPQSLYINRFWTGLWTNRSPLFTPISAMGLQLIQRQDVAWAGNDISFTPQYSAKRRFGHSRLNGIPFGPSEWPLTLMSYEDLTGKLWLIADTQAGVYSFTNSINACVNGDFSASSGNIPTNFALYNAGAISVTNSLGLGLGAVGGNYWEIQANAAVSAPLGFSIVSTASWGGWQSNTNYIISFYASQAGQANLTMLDEWNNPPAIRTWLVNPTLTGVMQRYVFLFNFGNNAIDPSIYFTSSPFSAPSGFQLYFSNVQIEPQKTTVSPWVAPASKTFIYSKNSAAVQSNFQSVADTLYWVDGHDAKKWNGASVTNLGIVTPLDTPTLSFGAGSLSPTVGYKYVFCYYNSTTGQPSSASPYSASTGPQTSKNITIGGNYGVDTQADKIQIYRTLDGGSIYYYNAVIANPASGTWSYTDSTPDSALNTDIVAPLAGINDPPPVGATLLAWYAGRLWTASGNTLYFSAGPDATNGVGEECWPAANNYTVPGAITALVPTSQGLVIFTIDDAYVIGGSTASTFSAPQLWQANMGVPSQNAVTQDGDIFFLYTSRGMVYGVGGGSLSMIGENIADKLALMTPARVYIAVHRSGIDEGVFLSDGQGKIYRFSQKSQAWDTAYNISGGCGAITSMETSPGAWNLVVGRAVGEGFMLYRDVTQYSDDGSAYAASVTFGSLVVAPSHSVAKIGSVTLQIVNVSGAYPAVSVLLNEILDNGIAPATFIALPNPVPDPPLIPLGLTLWSKRHDFKAAASPVPQYVQHLQLKIDFIAQQTADEIYSFGIS